MKKGIKKCNWCHEYKKCKYKKGRLHFCNPEHKQNYFDNHLPTLLKETQIEFNALVAGIGVCARCGKSFEQMQCSHVYTVKAYPNLRFDVLNALSMCGNHHMWWWHQEPGEAWPWFKEKYPERYSYLVFAKNQIKPWKIYEVKEVRKAIKERNLHALMRFKKEFSTAS